LNDFEKLDTVVVGVSKDSLESHNKFTEKNNLKFDIASDVDLEVIKAFDVWKEKNMYGKKTMGVERTTFIIDKHGIVRKIYSKVKVNGHVERVLKDLEELSIK
jgi:peroxiredoxin Q/BCP